MNFIPKAAIVSGSVWIAISIWKWWFSTPDISQLLFGVITGSIIVGSAKLYDLLLKLEDRIKELDSGLDALRKWAVDELEKK